MLGPLQCRETRKHVTCDVIFATVGTQPYWKLYPYAVSYLLFLYIFRIYGTTNRGYYISAHVLLNLLNELGKSDKMQGLPSILLLFRIEFTNSIIQKHEC